jgi:hypothetical protein
LHTNCFVSIPRFLCLQPRQGSQLIRMQLRH